MQAAKEKMSDMMSSAKANLEIQKAKVEAKVLKVFLFLLLSC